MSEAIQNAIAAHASSGLLLVVLMAWLEYVFPPVPGDSTMLFACFLAGTGALRIDAAIAACLASSVAGWTTAYAMSQRLGPCYVFLRAEVARARAARRA